MDYGDRQERATRLVQMFQRHPDQVSTLYRDYKGRSYRYKGRSYRASDIATHIVDQTDLGVSLVAIAGLVRQRLDQTDFGANLIATSGRKRH